MQEAAYRVASMLVALGEDGLLDLAADIVQKDEDEREPHEAILLRVIVDTMFDI